MLRIESMKSLLKGWKREKKVFSQASKEIFLVPFYPSNISSLCVVVCDCVNAQKCVHFVPYELVRLNVEQFSSNKSFMPLYTELY